uniref:Ovule protein n=1 Tax=Panagrellus redivivus TaxID=6233 RepID=A0A7E4W934_PANRE
MATVTTELDRSQIRSQNLAKLTSSNYGSSRLCKRCLFKHNLSVSKPNLVTLSMLCECTISPAELDVRNTSAYR